MEDEWLPLHEFDPSELCYGIPIDVRRIPSVTKRIINSRYVDSSQGFSLELILDVPHADEEYEDDEAYDAYAVIEALRDRMGSLLKETDRQFGFESDITEWDEGIGVITDFTENKKSVTDCIKFLLTQLDIFENCTLGVSLYLVSVSALLKEPGFTEVCEEIEKRARGEFSIRGKAELGPYDGIDAGSSFYQLFLLISPLCEFPLQFFRAHSEDNRLASPYYHYMFSKICGGLDCKLTLLKT
jgi:hypothetical protein